MRAALLVTMALALGACGGKKDAAPAPAAETAKARTPLQTAYEGLRQKLANDDLEGAKAAAVELAKVAEGAMQNGAKALGQAADIAAARLAFGETSKAYIELLVKSPELAADTFVFRCPMAEGYKKWVQLADGINNPYMGKQMLECGGKTDLAP